MRLRWIRRLGWGVLLVVLVVAPARLAQGPSAAVAVASPTIRLAHDPVPHAVGWTAIALGTGTLAAWVLLRRREHRPV